MTTLNLSEWICPKLTGMTDAFRNCSALTELNLSKFAPDNLTTASSTFLGCTSLKKLDLRSLNFSKLTTYSSLFGSATTNSVPYDCEITVNQSGYDFIRSKFPNYTNLKLV